MDCLNVSVVLSAGTCFGNDVGGKSKEMFATGGRKKYSCVHTYTQNVSPARRGGSQLLLYYSSVRAEISAELSTQALCS